MKIVERQPVTAEEFDALAASLDDEAERVDRQGQAQAARDCRRRASGCRDVARRLRAERGDVRLARR